MPIHGLSALLSQIRLLLTKTHRHDIRAGRHERGSSILGVIGQDNHIVRGRRIAPFFNQKLAHVHRIVDTSVQLMLGVVVVDANDQGLATRHLE